MGREPEASGTPPDGTIFLRVVLRIAVQNSKYVTSVSLSWLVLKADCKLGEEMMPKGVELIVGIVVQNAEYVVRPWL